MRFKRQTLGGGKRVSVVCAIMLMAALHFCYGYLLFSDSVKLYANTSDQVNINLKAESEINRESQELLKANDNTMENELNLSFDDELKTFAEDEIQSEAKFSSFGVPLKQETQDEQVQIKVIPCGMTVGVKIETDGIMVLGTGGINGESGGLHNPAEGIIIPGDLILSINGKELDNNEQLREEINASADGVNMKLKRDEEIIEVFIKPVMCIDDGINKIGVWVRDSTQGIGTVTYINPETMKFGALGHGIMDVDTKKLMSVKSGEVTSAQVYSIEKGKKGSPGELVGDIAEGEHFGRVKVNNQYGLYGIAESGIDCFRREPVGVATQNQITEGPAVILSNIGSDEVGEYQVNIETINKYSADDSKGLVIRITDENLLKKTNGIVQGMSGSPILQNDMIVGAVTHVFVQDPTKGYGIFIEKMLNQEKNF